MSLPSLDMKTPCSSGISIRPHSENFQGWMGISSPSLSSICRRGSAWRLLIQADGFRPFDEILVFSVGEEKVLDVALVREGSC